MTTKDWIYIGIIVILVVYLIFSRTRPSQVDTLNQHTIDSLTHVISIKQDSIKHSEAVVKTIDSTRKLVKTQIQTNDNHIKEVAKFYEIQVRTVDALDVAQLRSILTERYSPDSIK